MKHLILPLAWWLMASLVGCAHVPPKKYTPPKYDRRVVPENYAYEDGPKAGGKAWLEARRKEKGW